MKFLISLKPLSRDTERKLAEGFGDEMRFREVIDGLYLYSDKEPEVFSGGLFFGYKLYPKVKPRYMQLLNDYNEMDKVFDGKYLYIDLEKRNVFTDPLGLQPVFIGRNGISSNKKYLWLIGERTVTYLPPNKIWGIEGEAFSYRGMLIKFNYTEKTDINMEEASQILCEHLMKRMERIASTVNKTAKKVYIAFSGGVDSSLTYMLSKEAGLDPWLVTVSGGKSHDIKASTHSAELLDAGEKHIILSLDEDILRERDIVKIVELVETHDLMQISLATPLYILARYCGEGSVIFMGQGSDEMFGGYTKYINLYREKGEDAVDREIAMDVFSSYRNNFSREMRIADSMKSFLAYPLISPGIVRFSLQIPLKYKVRDEDDDMRKWLIRKVAGKTGIPEDIVYRRKRSMQYSSGSQNILSKIMGRREVRRKLYKYYLETREKYS